MIVQATDYHTAGEPFRIVTGGVDPLPGRTILEKRRYAPEHLDRVRELLVHEPRGHADMYGCFVTEPEDDGADLGVVFFHNAGYSTACGHGTIALATAALETGMLAATEPETSLVIDAPSGRLPVVGLGRGRPGAGRALPERPGLRGRDGPRGAGRGRRTSPSAAPSTPRSSFPAAVVPAELAAPDRGSAARSSARSRRSGSGCTRVEPDLRDIYGVIFWQDEGAGDGELVQRNVTVFADGEVDRSPCGSGTSARLALLDAAGLLPRGDRCGTGASSARSSSRAWWETTRSPARPPW